MQILKKTGLKAFNKAKEIGSDGVLNILREKNITGRGGAGFPTAKKWELAINTEADTKYVICNADEGEPGAFKDRLIIKKNPETLVEGILIACHTTNAREAFIYLRGEYDNLKSSLQKAINSVIKSAKTDITITIVSGAGAYVCGEETAIICSIEGSRGQPYYKPPFPPVKGLWGKPTIINNVETLTNVAQAVLFEDYNPNLRLASLSGNVTKPGVYEVEVGYNLCDLIQLGKPKNNVKAIYFGCFGGCIPSCDIELTPEKVCGKNCAIGSYTIVVADEKQSILELAISIARFYCHESCGKCTPCREGSVRILNILKAIKSGKAKKDDLDALEDLAKHINETSLCGLGQTSTNHLLTALQYFRSEFDEKLK